MLNKLEQFNNWVSRCFVWIGFAAMLLTMIVTCIDVVGAKVFNVPLSGALDIVVLCQIVAISFAAGSTLIAKRHIAVEFFFEILPRPLQLIVRPLIHLAGLGLFVLVVWQLGVLGYSFQQSGEYSATAYIPLFPFAIGAAVACVPVCLVLFHGFLRSFVRKLWK